MAELLEFLFQFVFEMLINLYDAIDHWRFTLGAIAGIGMAVALECLGPDAGVIHVLAVLLGLAGVVAGIVWETRTRC